MLKKGSDIVNKTEQILVTYLSVVFRSLKTIDAMYNKMGSKFQSAKASIKGIDCTQSFFT